MILLIASLALAAASFVDGLSTVSFLRKGMQEQNPLFGKDPSTLRIFGEGALIIGGEIAIATLLSYPSQYYGYIFATLFVAQAAVHIDRAIHNFRL